MYTTLEERKEKALELMERLDIYKPYIEGFKRNNDTCYYENFGGYWTWQNKELLEKQREIEETYNCTVYAITHEYAEFGECYSFLIVTDYKEEWIDLVLRANNTFYSFAYVWNKTYEEDSEFGTIAIKSYGGGIRRIS